MPGLGRFLKMLLRVLSLDVSASSTGWAFAFGQARGKMQFGTIKTKPNFSRAERLAYFRDRLVKLLFEFRPTHVVMEDIYSGLNPKTLVLLAKFNGVAEECCRTIAGIEPYIISTNTVKSFYKVKKKEDVFSAIVELMEWEEEGLSFKKHNDVIDAIAQLFCYYDQVLEVRKFRVEKPYGFLYEV